LKDRYRRASMTASYTGANGEIVSQTRSLPFGETRWQSGASLTDYGFTGQRSFDSEFGLLFYVARWYDPQLGRFAQADTLVPGGLPIDFDRYAYVRNSPTGAVDPTGHGAYCGDDYDPACRSARSLTTEWMLLAKYRYGITLSNGGDKVWDLTNAKLVYDSLGNVDTLLNGQLKSLVGGTTFKLMKQDSKMGQYHGETHLDGSGIDFYTRGNDVIRQMNIYHEVGHLLDNVPVMRDVFTHAVESESNPGWVSNDIINSDALVRGRVPDPYYGDTDATQAYDNLGPSEQWADAFANYVAGNIDLEDPAGLAMYGFVTDVLVPYIGTP